MKKQAEAFARMAHRGARTGGADYLDNLARVARIVAPWGEEAEAIAWLHNIEKDTLNDARQLGVHFGTFVAQCVSLISEPFVSERSARKAYANDVLRRIGTDHQLALVVRVADRIVAVDNALKAGQFVTLRNHVEEYPDFREAAFRAGLCDNLWKRLEACVADAQVFLTAQEDAA